MKVIKTETETGTIQRDKGINTKQGFIFYSKDGIDWKIQYPDGGFRYGRVTPDKICKFFKALADGKTINEADDLAFKSKTK